MSENRERSYNEGLRENFGELLNVHAELVQDAKYISDKIILDDKSNSTDFSFLYNLEDFERRSLVRAIFACIEGSSFYLRKHIAMHNDQLLTPEVLLALREKQIDISNAGCVATKNIKANSLYLLRLTVDTFNKLYLPIPEYALIPIRCEGHDFEGLIPSAKVRDRVMHPKKIEDLKISDKEMLSLILAFRWFHGFIKNAVFLVAAHTLEDAKQMRLEINELNKRKEHLENQVKIAREKI